MKRIEIEPKRTTAKINSNKNKTNNKPDRRYLIAVSIIAGIITVINENGQFEVYRQRGINKLSQEVIITLINVGFLHRNWRDYKELPSNITIKYEDEEILGKAKATFPINEAMAILGMK